MLDPTEFGKAMAAIVKEAVAPLVKRIDDLESRQPEKGDPGQDAEPVDVEALQEAVVARLLASNKLETLAELKAVEAVAAHFDAHPVRDGKDGDPGPRGERGEAGEKGADGAGIADLLIDRDGVLTATFTDGRMKSLGVIVGKDGAPGRDGKDMTALSAEFDDTGLTIRTAAGDIRKEFELPHDGGYWSENNRTHRKGAIVTHNGVAFIAKRYTTAEPKAEANEDWRILARKGRDGRDGRNGIDKTKPAKVNGDA